MVPVGGAPEWSEARDHEATTRRHMRACGQTEQTDRQEKMESGAERPQKKKDETERRAKAAEKGRPREK